MCDFQFLSLVLVWQKAAQSVSAMILCTRGTEDEFYRFKLERQHPGHQYFEGCSGSPILNTAGGQASFVSGIDGEENGVFGPNRNM